MLFVMSKVEVGWGLGIWLEKGLKEPTIHWRTDMYIRGAIRTHESPVLRQEDDSDPENDGY